MTVHSIQIDTSPSTGKHHLRGLDIMSSLQLDGTPIMAKYSGFPPFTAHPYILSPGYAHLVASPHEFRPVLGEKLARLQNTLPGLGQERLRQAKADIVYLKSVLDGEGEDAAQSKAVVVWAANKA